MMEENIIHYIEVNKVFTLATSVDDLPYCANCFYAFDVENKTLVFLSDSNTRHISEALINNKVGGTIQNGVTEVSKLQGIQFVGEFINPSVADQEIFYQIYYEKYPFAKDIPAPVWAVKLNWLKMTDNTLGFGKKLIWER